MLRANLPNPSILKNIRSNAFPVTWDLSYEIFFNAQFLKTVKALIVNFEEY